jgi:hypothetical protein
MAQGGTGRFVTLKRTVFGCWLSFPPIIRACVGKPTLYGRQGPCQQAATLTCSMLNSVREWHGDSAYRVHSLQGIGSGEDRRSGCGWRVV